MESILSLKKRRKRFFWALYLCFCCSFLVFCAFYTYSGFRTSSLYNHPLKYTSTAMTVGTVGGVGTRHIPRFPTIEHTIMDPSSRTSDSSSLSSASSPIDDETPSKNSKSVISNNGRAIDESEVDVNSAVAMNFTTSLITIDDEGLPAELTCRSSVVRPKLVLLWTPFFGSWDYLQTHSFRTCVECSNCRTTTDRNLLLESDAVVFHARDMSAADVPAVRLSNQRWIFYCLESPPYSDFPGLDFMHGMFNWTMTYRADSDVLTEYGSFKKMQPPRKLDISVLRESWQWKTKSVVWMSSHCPTHGGRDDYVAQLKKYIDVDEFGKCGQLSCPPASTEHCMRNFAAKYKFFLAFENSICQDYVTEKFFRTLKYDMVPVVFGGADYRKRAPPGSYVDALSFKSPKHLAFFLAGVGNDFSLYRSYFEWRKDFVVTMDNRKECALCSMLHKQEGKRSVYKDIRKWWVADGKCHKWTPKG